MTDIHEHTVELSLLPERATIIDLGCRGFLFTKYFREKKHLVHPVDIDILHEGISYYRCAITGEDGRVSVEHTNDPQGTKVRPGDEIPCYTLESFMEGIGVKFADLIKVDIEGSEYPMIMALTKAPAKQLSIEFHLHTGAYTQKEMMEMEEKLARLGYVIKRHKIEERYGAGLNYWDSLFILR